MAGRLQFQFDFSKPGREKRRESPRRRILLLGDFSGLNPVTPELAARKPHRVDSDRFDELLARLSPRLGLELEGAEEIFIEFGQMEDFHPDALYKRLAVFQNLRQLRARLENPATYAAAAEELKHGQVERPPEAEVPIAGKPGPEITEEKGLFDQLLGGPIQAKPATPGQDAIENLIRGLVEPHLNKSADLSQQPQFLSAVDDAIAQTMRRILHHPKFQELEATWRGLAWLCDNIEDLEETPVYLLDAKADELALDLERSEGSVEKTAIYRLLTENSLAIPGGEPWSLVAGLYEFGESASGLGLLELLGAVSALCGGVFVAGASPRLLGCDSLAATPDASSWIQPEDESAKAWSSLRLSPVAPYIALALPRFMLRLPYGKQSDPTENFRFEEMPLHPSHEAYLWGNSSIAIASLIARSWLEEEDTEPGTLRDIGDLPYHVYDDNGDKAVKPCAETYLNEKTANAILDAGLIPVLSVRSQNRLIVPLLQSIGKPPTSLI